MTKINSLIKYLAYGILISFLLPVIKFGGIGFKPDLLFLFLSIPFLFIKKTNYSILKALFLTMSCIFVSMIISNNAGLYYLGRASFSFDFPTDFYQIFSRISGFALFFMIAISNIIKYREFLNISSLIFLFGLIFGVLQFLDIGVVKDLSLKYYALTETQMSGFQSLNFRGFGTAGNIITWGGLCGFIFYFFYFLEFDKKIKFVGCILAVFNILITASRSALIAWIVSFIVVYFYNTIFIKKNVLLFIKNTIYAVVFSTILWVVANLFIPERLEFLELRLTKSEEDLTEGGRGAQLNYFLRILDQNETNYLFGIGKPVLNDLGFMEMEPLFLLVAYGVVGIILHYLLIYIVMKFALKVRKVNLKVFLFVLSSLICYLIFSIGFFFFREPYSGMIYWCVLGYLLGASYKSYIYGSNKI